MLTVATKRLAQEFRDLIRRIAGCDTDREVRHVARVIVSSIFDDNCITSHRGGPSPGRSHVRPYSRVRADTSDSEQTLRLVERRGQMGLSGLHGSISRDAGSVAERNGRTPMAEVVRYESYDGIEIPSSAALPRQDQRQRALARARPAA